MTPEQVFLNMMKRVCLRPAMYVGIAKLRLITTFFFGIAWGYDTAHHQRDFLSTEIKEGLWDGFGYWLMHKYYIDHPAWGMERILFHQYEHDHMKAITAIPTEYEEFLKHKKEYNRNFQEIRHLALTQLQAKYNADYGAPECNECEALLL